MNKAEADEIRRRMKNHASPFVGDAGVGMVPKYVVQGRVLIIRESHLRQLLKVLGMGIFGPGLTWLYFSLSEMRRHPWWIVLLVGFMNFVGWILLMRCTYQWLFRRRIEYDFIQKTFSLYTAGKKVEKVISLNKPEQLQVAQTWYSNDGNWIETFTLRICDDEGTSFDLCTSDQKASIDAIYQKILSSVV